MLLQGSTRCSPRSLLSARKTHHAARAHARVTSPAPRVDAGTPTELGTENRHRHACGSAVAAREPPPSRAGLSRLLGSFESRQTLWGGSPGSGLPAGTDDWLTDPQTHHRDPQSQPRSTSG